MFLKSKNKELEDVFDETMEIIKRNSPKDLPMKSFEICLKDLINYVDEEDPKMIDRYIAFKNLVGSYIGEEIEFPLLKKVILDRYSIYVDKEKVERHLKRFSETVLTP
ncbi:MAG: hypothetical protein J7K87_04475 [Candidatus Aenigmarchaeota archaeon]|nr:hypothetical protein [Candidatus Aenigmarchaeota archaeon]